MAGVEKKRYWLIDVGRRFEERGKKGGGKGNDADHPKSRAKSFPRKSIGPGKEERLVAVWPPGGGGRGGGG